MPPYDSSGGDDASSTNDMQALVLPPPPQRSTKKNVPGSRSTSGFLSLGDLWARIQAFFASTLYFIFDAPGSMRRRTLWTLVVATVLRWGAYVPLPDMDRVMYLAATMREAAGASDTTLTQNLVSLFASSKGMLDALGGASNELPLNVMIVGVQPLIFSNLLSSAFLGLGLLPNLKQLRSDNPDLFIDSLSQVNRGVCLLAGLLMSYSTAASWQTYAAVTADPATFVAQTTLMLFAGCSATQLLCDEVTNKGWGNGVTLAIVVSVLGGFADCARKTIAAVIAGTIPVLHAWMLFTFAIVVIVAAVVLEDGRVSLPLRFFKTVGSGSDDSLLLREAALRPKDNDTLPLKISPGGIMPVIATAVLFQIASGVWQLVTGGATPPIDDTLPWALPEAERAAATVKCVAFHGLYAITLFLVGMVSLEDGARGASDFITKMQARVVGARPGVNTVRLIRRMSQGSRFAGAAILAVVATLCHLADKHVSLTVGAAAGYTSLIIVASYALTVRRQYIAYASAGAPVPPGAGAGIGRRLRRRKEEARIERARAKEGGEDVDWEEKRRPLGLLM